MARKIVVFTLKDRWLKKFGGEKSEGFFKQKLGEYELWATWCRENSKMDKEEFDVFCQLLPNEDTEIYLFLHSGDLIYYNPESECMRSDIDEYGGVYKFSENIENKLLSDKKMIKSLVAFNHEPDFPVIEFLNDHFNEEGLINLLEIQYVK